MNYVFSLIVLVGWLYGIALAKGCLSTTFAIIIPPWALYLSVEKIAAMLGWL